VDFIKKKNAVWECTSVVDLLLEALGSIPTTGVKRKM
jgi:hypothetical protein